jgi:hypothetical protein
MFTYFSDFLVVGLIGTKNVGKSFLSNVIAGASTDLLNGNTLQNEVFSTTGIHSDLTIDCYVTSDRIIILDTSPLLVNLKRDMINSELDDIKTIMLLLHTCHLLINVHDGFPDLSISRLLNQAEQFSPHEFKHRPLFASIGNKIQPGTKKSPQVDSRVHEANDVLLIPDLGDPSVDLYYDVDDIIQRFQEIVFMKKRFSMTDNDNEAFTEIVWWKRFEKAVEKLKKEKADYFLRKYENLKDKFHQSIENC